MGVFAFAKRDTVGYIETSPCTIKRDFTANVRGIFDDNELRILLQAAKKNAPNGKNG